MGDGIRVDSFVAGTVHPSLDLMTNGRQDTSITCEVIAFDLRTIRWDGRRLNVQKHGGWQADDLAELPSVRLGARLSGSWPTLEDKSLNMFERRQGSGRKEKGGEISSVC